MKKHFINKLWGLLSFLIIPIPLYLTFALKEYIDMFEYVMMGIVFTLQLIIIAIFFLAKSKWSEWVLKQANKQEISQAIVNN